MVSRVTTLCDSLGEHPTTSARHTDERSRAILAWFSPSAGFGGVVLDRPRCDRGGWTGSFVRSCPRAFLLHRRDQSRDPSLRMRCSSHPSPVLRSPRTSAARRSTSPLAYMSRFAVTAAAQTDLPRSVLLLPRVLRSIPRGVLPRVALRTSTRQSWPSPGHERLGSPVVNVSRLQASLDVAARVVASSKEAFDIQLQTRSSRSVLWTCYPALRRVPGRDSHPLEKYSTELTFVRGAPCGDSRRTNGRLRNPLEDTRSRLSGQAGSGQAGLPVLQRQCSIDARVISVWDPFRRPSPDGR